MELPVVNHSDYEAKIKDDNKFPIKKFGELAKYLLENKIVKKVSLKLEKLDIIKNTESSMDS